MPECIFCRASGPLTKEHIIPSWASEAIKKRRPEVAGFQTDDRSRESVYSSREMDLAPRVVCGGSKDSCNSGWMHDLELLVKPFFARMMRGQPQTLSVRRQTLASTWAVMKAMVAESLKPGPTTYFTQAERSGLRRTKKPPEGLLIWLAHSVTGDAGWAEDLPIAWEGIDGTQIPGYAVALQIDHLLILTLAHRFQLGPRFTGVSFPISFGPAAIPIWPITGPQRWPPYMAFGRASINDWFRWWRTARPTVDEAVESQGWDMPPEPGR